MKTREKQRVSPKVQRVPATALSSIERSRIRRKAIYDNKKLHMEVQEKDRERKKLKAIEKAMRREEDPEEAERYREKERERKRKQRLVKKKAKEAASEKLTTPVKRKIKKQENKLRWKFKEKESAVKDSSKEGSSSSPSTSEKLVISKAIWGHLSPKSRHKVARSLKISPEIPKGLNYAIRKELGVNISNPYDIGQEKEMIFQRDIRLFFERPDIARTCPDTKRMVPDPAERGKKVPARYRLGTIKMLHWRFEAETGVVCSLECFRQNIPFDVVRPKPNDWGTCLCAKCINPEMKLEALANLTNDSSFRWDDGKSYNAIGDLIGRIKAVDVDNRG